MSCKVYTEMPKLYDQELRNKNDIHGIESLIMPDKKIRYVTTIKV